MIDQQLIESAKQIRKRYIKAMSNLSIYEQDVRNLANFLQEKSKVFEKIQDVELKKKPSKEELEKVTRLIVDEITSIENEEQKILKKVESINVEIDKLQKEEEVLYKTIKKRYPKLSDDQIKEEIQSYLEE
jgi:chromosome segregation ATPase